jgi:tetratricopeptide (TPR) repeat protein/energy-coupling factor transporter ATP-binding protein EcfA2
MFKYDPHQKTEREIKETFINGQKYLEDIIDDLGPKNKKLSNQSVIIVGQRGTGKSHFLRMAAIRINNDKTLNKYYLPVIFPEEMYKVGSLYHLLKDAIGRVFSVIKKIPVDQNNNIEPLENQFTESCAMRFQGSKIEQKNQRIEVENILFSLLIKISTFIGKKIVFLLENLQHLFGEKLSTDELKRLRGFLQENPDSLLIIGSAVTVFEAVDKYGEPFYNFFKFRRLTGLNKDEVQLFLKIEGRRRLNPDIDNKTKKFRGEIEIFRILTGGNPRLILFLYDILEENEELLIDDILKKIAELTPYFKSETEKLTPPKQMVIDALCENVPAQTPSEIAGYLNESVGIVNENLKRLLQEGWVKILETEKGENIKKSETFYAISDYFYRIWYQIRQSVTLDENIKWMAELACLLFNKSELEEKLKCKDIPIKPVFEKALELLQSKPFLDFKSKLDEKYERVLYEESKNIFYQLMDAEKWQEMIEEANRMIENGKLLHIAYFTKGFANQALTHPDKAINFYQEFLKRIPNESKVLFLIGECFLQLEDYNKALEYFEKAVEVDPDEYYAYMSIGKTFYLLGNYRESSNALEQSIKNYKKYIHHTANPENSDPEYFKITKKFADKIFNKVKSIGDLTKPGISIKKRIEAMQALLWLGEFNGVETIISSFFDKLENTALGKRPIKEVKELYAFLMLETILRLNGESVEKHPGITAKYFLKAGFLLNDKRPIEERILEFLVNYIKNTEKSKINKKELTNIFSEWHEMNIVLPEFLIALIDALINPKSRAAQVWSSDPLFKEVLKMLK